MGGIPRVIDPTSRAARNNPYEAYHSIRETAAAIPAGQLQVAHGAIPRSGRTA